MFIRDSQLRASSLRDALLDIDSDPVMDTTTSATLSYWEIFQDCKLCCFSLLITVSSSMAIGSFFTQIKSDSQSLPQMLFFTKLFTDVLGRPTALLISINSDYTISIISFIRLLLVPIFFLAATSDSPEDFPNSDELLIGLVAFFAFTSGYIVTVCFQVGPSCLPDNCDESTITKQASLLNVFLCASIVLGVLLALPAVVMS